MTRLLVVEPGYCPYQAGFPSAIAAASEVIEGESQILKPFGTPRIGLIWNCKSNIFLLATSTMQDWLALVHIALSWELMC